MNRMTASFLKALVILLGIGALAFLLWQPHVEGVNAHATTLSEIYFDDPFLAFAYIASAPFFMALYQAFILLNHIGQNNVFSKDSVRALRTIKYCATVMIAFIAIGVTWLMLGESDDRPPIIAMGTVATLISLAIAFTAATFEKKVQHAA